MDFLLPMLAWDNILAVAYELFICFERFLMKLATVLFWDLDEVAADETVTKDYTDASYEVCLCFGYLVLIYCPVFPKPLLIIEDWRLILNCCAGA